MGSSAKLHDDGRAPSWALHGHGNKRIGEQPISMMMAELPLGLSMILGRKAAPLAHLTCIYAHIDVYKYICKYML